LNGRLRSCAAEPDFGGLSRSTLTWLTIAAVAVLNLWQIG
jgi:hypothetical protein